MCFLPLRASSRAPGENLQRTFKSTSPCIFFFILQVGSLSEIRAGHPNWEWAADLYDGIGNLYQDQAKFDEALEWYTKALRIVESNSQSCDEIARLALSRAVSYERIGMVYRKQGEFGDNKSGLGNALLQFQKALEIKTSIFGSDHQELAVCYGHIGQVLGSMQRHEEALVQLQKCHDIEVKHHGSDSWTVAVALQGMGMSYRKLGLYEKALECCQKEREIVLRLHGADHCSTADSHETVGSVFFFMKKYEEALVQHQRALEIRTRMLPPNNPETKRGLVKIAITLMKLGRHEQAQLFFQKYGIPAEMARNPALLQRLIQSIEGNS
jgi:nephrocystin-3